MRLLQLEYFLDVATTQNMTRSARNLHIAQPSLSRSIHELELEIGMPLFTRNGRALALNKAGERFAEIVSSSLGTLRTGVQDIRQDMTNHANEFTIRIESSTTLIPALLNYLEQQLPGVKIKLIQHGLENNQLTHYDFEFTTHPIKGNENLLLISEKIRIAFARKSSSVAIADASTITADELANYSLITTEQNPLRELVLRTVHKYNANIHPDFVTGDRSTILGMVRAGVGYCFIPDKSWPQADLTDIKLFSFAPDSLNRNIYLSMPERNILNSQQAAVAKEITNFFQGLPQVE
jgi:DNA-binding transcriptional LysR family regulator